MKNNSESFDPRIVEIEENLLIDYQFLIQELMIKKGISRKDLARKARISRARLSQMLSAEANPTIKTIARIFYALDEEVCVASQSRMKENLAEIHADSPKWELVEGNGALARRNDEAQMVALVKESLASNDNYKKQVLQWDFESNSLTLEAA